MQQADSNAEIESLIQALPDAVIVISSERRVAALNDAARRLFPALRPTDLLAKGLRAPDVLDGLAQILAGAEKKHVLWLDRVPVERQFHVHLARFLWKERLYVVAALHDATEARTLDRMRADFVANASHELRTPLASVLGFIETLQGPARNDAAAREKFLDIMRAQAQRMTRLVDDLLSLSRIEQNLHIRPELLVDLSAVAGHIIDSMSAIAEDQGILLQLSNPGPALVLGDRDELLRVVENLVENAIKYGAGSPVAVSVAVSEGQARLQISDRGPGIAQEHLPRLTERFYRIDAGESRAKGGTGLGLAIVKHIVARHQGRLTVESTPGEGAVFTVSLPIAP